MSDSPISPLGEAPRFLAYQVERVGLAVEEQPGSGNFYPQPWPLLRASVSIGVNDQIPRAAVALGPGPLLEPPDQAGAFFRDWQLLDRDGQLRNAWELLGGGRRMQVRTVRQQPQDDWCLFEGWIDNIQLGWSGASAARGQARTLELQGTSTIAAAAREVSQALFGQWRRSRRAVETIIYDAVPQSWQHECVHVGLPAVFNPRGRPNCDPRPLTLDDGRKVYVFSDERDPDDPRATWWTLSRVLRYLQWAGTQSGPPVPSDPNDPYTQTYVASIGHANVRPWTSVGLWHSKLQGGEYNTSESSIDVGPNLDDFVAAHLQGVVYAGDASEPFLTLQRPLQTLAVHGMSVMEAIALACDRGAALCHVEHTINTSGRVLTYLRFTSRNDRAAEESEHVDGQSAPFPEGITVPFDGSPGDPSYRMVPRATYQSGRGVYLWVPSDRVDDTAWSTAQIWARAIHVEGSIGMAVGGLRDRVLVIGDVSEYESTLPLRPGWTVNSDWDVNQGSQPAIDAAVAAVFSDTFRSKYGGGFWSQYLYGEVGRLWVLNEDGEFSDAANTYVRGTGPFSTAADWRPFKFLTTGGVRDLVGRTDDGWSARGRRFQPVLAWTRNTHLPLGAVVLLSFDGGSNWMTPIETGVAASFDRERCAVRITTPDLTQVVNPRDRSQNFATQYIRGQLRVRVAALVEGDDPLQAWALAQSGGPGNGWTAVLDRRAAYGRRLRLQPGTSQPAATNLLLSDAKFSGGLEGFSQDGQSMALREAEQARRELTVPRWAGSVVIPWLWRDRFGPVTGYRPGDEVLGIKTQDAVTFLDFTQGDASRPAPRIVSVTHRFANGQTPEQSTVLAIESAAPALALGGVR